PRVVDASAKRPRGAEVRERVLHAALECFGAFGFEGTSTRAVAERAGLSHPLLLYHFESKDQLWRSTMEDVIRRYRANLDERVAQVAADDPAGALQAFIENFVEFSAVTPQLHRIMTQESTQGSERIHWLIDTHLRASFDAVCRSIRRAQAQGRVRPGEPARLYYAVIGLAGTLLSVSTEFEKLTGRNVFEPREIRKSIETIHEFLFLD
ncbi:MAG TPA: TetR family transcriptional regulator, partial [Nevskiaceae bacterium]|nr:TetR family transcriptional regulator [Nevskiaceae bacterium]